MRQNVLNLIWKFPGFVPFGANLTHFGAKSGNRVLYFDWQEGGLYIAEAQIGDKAIYECVATNVAGTATKIITLIVYSKSSNIVFYTCRYAALYFVFIWIIFFFF